MIVLIVTVKNWNIANVKELRKRLDKSQDIQIELITDKEKLTLETVTDLNPDYIFFPHWSWIIPESIFSHFNCIVFHTADLPDGRGGSPIQNQIIRKNYYTKISALAVCSELDAGDIYLKEDIYLGIGNVEEMLSEISRKIFFKMIPEIIIKKPKAIPQKGVVFEFKRRMRDESDLSQFQGISLRDYYDFIRMVDGEGYPNAFIELNGFIITFSEAVTKGGKIMGRFEIEKKK